MKVITNVAIFVFCSLIALSLADFTSTPFVYYGMSDASAAAVIEEDIFVVADDEDNILRFYKTGQPQSIFSYDLTAYLGTEPDYPEADIEGTTVIGDTIYWITSHGRNKDGQMRPNRYRFFAIKVKFSGSSISVRPMGTPCRTLVDDMIKTDNLRCLKLDKATQLGATKISGSKLKNLAPKKEGLNIEALCAAPDGNSIYIGLRNPRYKSKAIVVPLNNPKQVVENQQSPVFADPLLWDLKGYGIRSMEYSQFHSTFFIVAGPHSDEPAKFTLYRWSGSRDDQPLFVQSINSDFTPEALITFKNSPELLLLSDDGSLAVSVSDASECMQDKLSKDGKCLNKFLADPSQKCFRAISFLLQD